jgi:peptide deformylase
MFRKIHSNRDPKDTILSPANSVKQSFKPYIEQTSVTITRTNEKAPQATICAHAHQYGYFSRVIIYHATQSRSGRSSSKASL